MERSAQHSGKPLSLSGKTSSSNSLFRQNFHGGKVSERKSSCGETYSEKTFFRKTSCGENFYPETYSEKTFFRKTFVRGKLLPPWENFLKLSGKTFFRSKLIETKSFCEKTFHRGKLIREKFLWKNFFGEKFSWETLFHEKLFEKKSSSTKLPEKTYQAKLLHQKLLSQKKFLGEKFHGENFFCGKLLSRKTSTGISSHPQKLSGTEERGTVPEKMEFGWCLFWIMTILKILEIHHLTQLYKGKVRNDCGLYSGQGKLLQENFFRENLSSRKLLQRGVNHPIDSRVHPR